MEVKILYFLDRTFTIRRLSNIDGTRSIFSATGTAAGYPCSWQEPSPETLEAQGHVQNLYECYTDISCPIKDGDQIVQAGITYAVRDVEVMDFGSTQYKMIIASKGDIG